MEIHDIMNIEELRNRMENDLFLLKELSAVFINDSDKLLQRINEAILNKDNKLLTKAAHTIKGAVANFSAHKAYNAALKIENMGKSGELEKINEAYNDLRGNIEDLKSALREIVKKSDW